MSLLSPSLQAFVLIAEYKSVHQAAQALHITQTATTQRLRSLEQRLGTSLFVRSRRGMLLTPEGETLLRYCHGCQELESNTLQQIQASGQTVPVLVKITGPTSLMSSRIIPQSFAVLDEFPQLLLHFDITDQETRHIQLREGQCQLAIIQPEHISLEMEAKPLQPEEYILVCTAAWRGRPLREIIEQEAIVDYAPDDQMTFHYLKRFDLFDLCNHRRHFVNRTESMATMLVAGFGYGLLTKEFSQPYVDSGQLIVLNEEQQYENHLSLAWYPRPQLPAYWSHLIAAFK